VQALAGGKVTGEESAAIALTKPFKPSQQGSVRSAQKLVGWLRGCGGLRAEPCGAARRLQIV